MTSLDENASPTHPGLLKAPTGIAGLDEITFGGLPAGRPTLICGSAGCGKTLMATEFLVRGVAEHGEPGVLVSFDERAEDLAANVRSLGFDLDALADAGKFLIDYVHIERTEIEETGEYDLEGLFLRLGWAIDSIGAKRIVLDTIENLFSGFTNEGVLRAELRRLFRWLKDRGVTAVITGERGEGTLTRHGLEEYLSDCVILLDHRVHDQLATRRLRIVKYRGSVHGTNEYPFLIDERGIEVLPVTSLKLEHEASTERVSTGIVGLDEMLAGEGYFRGSSVLVSGRAGTGKTTLAAHFVDAACRRGERAAVFAFEESFAQYNRNMSGIGMELASWKADGLLQFHASRPTLHGLERHLVTIHKLIRDFQPSVVVMDPITNFLSVGTSEDVRTMLMRLVDLLKGNNVTSLFTSLTTGSEMEQTEVGISSLMDTWLLVREIELSGERNRTINVIKSRGMPHSNQVREMLITPQGVQLTDVYLGPGGVLTGAARAAQEALEEASTLARKEETERKQREIERRRKALEARITALRLEFATEEEESLRQIAQEDALEDQRLVNRTEMARVRRVGPAANQVKPVDGQEGQP